MGAMHPISQKTRLGIMLALVKGLKRPCTLKLAIWLVSRPLDV